MRLELAQAESGDSSGLFGDLNLDFDFKPPTGVGIVIESGAVTGGGFLTYEEPIGRYAGILDLKFGEDIGLVAVALITTKLPGGGYALFINIGVTFSPPITLPYNFNLAGCGGLLALNRTMDIKALRTGLKNHTLDSILFPEDPILNAAKIISDSERVFPIQEGRFIVGPMAKLGWGPDGLVVADVAVVFELPAPLVIAILGQITAKVPKSDQAKIVIRLDVLGVIDIAKKSLEIDATLFDSRIVQYDLSGDAALRMNWGSNPVFAMSLGGWHPKFDPPPKFPKLRRLKISLRSTSNFDLSAKLYNALTSNTLQVGAKLELHAEACGAEVDGHISFDTLIFFSPFAFEADISGGVSASFKGRDIASVRLKVDLSGPTPWHAKGKAKISVLRWDVTARFNKTWGSDNKARLPTVDPSEPFLSEVRTPGNWNAAILPRRTAVESLKSADPGETPDPGYLLVHPAGALEVRQRLLPLDLHLELFANAEVKDHFVFGIALTLGPVLQPGTETVAPAVHTEDVREHFARGQFRSISKSSRLSKPSYERFKAGIRVGPTTPRLDGAPQPCKLEFESILIKGDGASETPAATPHPPARWPKLKRTLSIAAFTRATLKMRRLGKFSIPNPSRINTSDELYTIVYAESLLRATDVLPAGAEGMTQTEAEGLVQAAVAADPTRSLLVVPEFEEKPV